MVWLFDRLFRRTFLRPSTAADPILFQVKLARPLQKEVLLKNDLSLGGTAAKLCDARPLIAGWDS